MSLEGAVLVSVTSVERREMGGGAGGRLQIEGYPVSVTCVCVAPFKNAIFMLFLLRGLLTGSYESKRPENA